MRANVDLSALAASLQQSDRHPRIVKKIAQVTAAASATKDLSDALAAIDLLEENDRAREAERRTADASHALTLSALWTHAVVLYTRATETDAIDRLKWFGRSSLPPEYVNFHKDIM